MPQVFQVIRCYKCLAFQVHQVKKSNKWVCKLCGEKQSIKRHYGIGTGKECRLHVQKLNEMRGENTEQNLSNVDSDDDFENSEDNTMHIGEAITIKNESKWYNYVDKIDETNGLSIDEDNETLFGKEVVLDIPKKRKKLFNKNRRNRKMAHKSQQSEKGYCEDDITCESLSVPICNGTRVSSKNSLGKKQIIFVPPTTKINSKWSEYNDITNYGSENIDSQTNDMPNSDFSNYENNMSNSSIRANTKRDNFKTDISNNPMNNKNEKNIKSIYNKQKSKWAEFVDNAVCGNEQVKYYSQDFENAPKKDNTNPNLSNLFSLCDDYDLDSVLDI